MSRLVLIVDDEPGILAALSGILGDEGYETLTTRSGGEAVDLYRRHQPDAVFLDIWLPDRDGLETLQALREEDPSAAVIMMSGHGTTQTAVKAIKMGAFEYLEKPLSYNRTVEAVEGALAYRRELAADHGGVVRALEQGRTRFELAREIHPPPGHPLLAVTDVPQRTIRRSTVLYGLGLHSGGRTGMAIQPLPPGSGVHFVTLPTHRVIPAHVSQVADTDYATTLSSGGESIRTVEHLLSALHAYGVTNLLIKVHGEIPVLDGSALEFCKTLEEIGVEDQDEPRRELVVDRRYRVGTDDGKLLEIEPHDGFAVSYELSYPPPIGEQRFEMALSHPDEYKREIAPARTFGFMKDLKMMNELGLGSGGRLDNFILVGEGEVINTELRFPDEFVRHKVLDVIGDLYLLGFPIRGRVTARRTGHRDNIALLREIGGFSPG
ncbi:MAG TPA: UDP-3-O-acyl-N-acetylglucosamine deacetylase [Thermoanaerobaculia bacterium]|nr:UDP-3-O-acyl-N-acetylglucosamine deacetylase [Thermoanaerobaculia bacterium]